MRHSLSKVATAALALSLGLAAAASLVGISFSLAAERSATTALRTYIPAASTLDQLLAVMVDQETGERGYVISGEARFLQPYTAGQADTPRLVRVLRVQIRTDPSAGSKLAEVVRRYERWLKTFARPQVADVQHGDAAAAVVAERSGRGKALFDDLRRAVARLGAIIASRQRAETTHVRSLQEDVFWLMVAMLACVIVGLGVGFVFLRRWVIRPVQALDRSVSTAGEEQAVVQPSGPAEVASLGASIEAMRLRLRRQGVEIGEQRHIVGVLQEALLPRGLPRFEHFSFASRYVPAATEAGVGGDWFNVRRAGPTRLFVAVGDVAGKGLEAAASMASLRYAVNAYAAEDPDPGSVLTRLSSLVDLASTDRFATVVSCLIDAEAGELTVASAGHPPAVIVSPAGTAPVAVETGPPIGLHRHVYRSRTVSFESPAAALLFSDGLIERRAEPLDVSLDRLLRLAVAEFPLESLLDHLLGCATAERRDDVVVCGVRIVPA